MSNHTYAYRPLPTRQTSIVVTAAMYTVFKANIHRWRGLRPRHLFRGFLCITFEQSRYRSSHHNTDERTDRRTDPLVKPSFHWWSHSFPWWNP